MRSAAGEFQNAAPRSKRADLHRYVALVKSTITDLPAGIQSPRENCAVRHQRQAVRTTCGSTCDTSQEPNAADI